MLTENYVVISIQKYQNYFQLLEIDSSVNLMDIKGSVSASDFHVVLIYSYFINK